jgi:transglutaminase-like putative cysteine protease
MRLSSFEKPFANLAEPPTVENTMEAMRGVAIKAQLDYGLRRLAEEIVREVQPRDPLSELAAIYYWVLSHVRYTRDPSIVEQVKTPRATIEDGVGDCDCMATLLGALAMTLGYQVRFVAASYDGSGEPSHVWVEAETKSGWFALDPVPGRRGARALSTATATNIVNV